MSFFWCKRLTSLSAKNALSPSGSVMIKSKSKSKHAVIINGTSNAPTELEMEGFVLIIILKVSSNQKQANKENGVLGFISIFY